MKEFIVKQDRLSEKERRNLSILDAIRRGGEISRAEISKITGLNIVTISNYVSKYVKDKLVLETGYDISSGGRRPELLKINREYAYSIGIDLGAPHLTPDAPIVGVILDVSGKVVASKKIIKVKESFEKLTDKVIGLIGDLIKESGIPGGNITGIGVGIWGVLDRYRGMVRYAVEDEQIVSYTNLLGRLEDAFDVPAIIEHDAMLAAFGERWSGIGAGSIADNLIFLCSDSSCGLIINGELYLGASRGAGELNLNPPPAGEKGKPHECWVDLDSGCGFRSRGIDLGVPDKIRMDLKENPEEDSIVLKLADNDPEKIDFNIAVKATEEGDEKAKKALEEAGDYLGVKAAFLINFLNPEVVVIGRGIEKAGDTFFTALRKSVRKWGYEESTKIVKIFPTSLGDKGIAIGAAGLVTHDMFSKV